MAVNYSNAVKITRMQAVADIIAQKVPAPATGTAVAGKLVIGSGAGPGQLLTTTLASLNLAATVGAVSTAAPITLVFSGLPITGVGLADGIANTAEIRTNAGDVVVSGLTVGTWGSDIVLTSPSITTGQTVKVVSASIRHG